MKEQQKEWEDRFEREFEVYFDGIERALSDIDGDKFKSFITANFIERSELLRAIEEHKLSEVLGTYGKNDHLHIQHNVGWNAALEALKHELHL